MKISIKKHSILLTILMLIFSANVFCSASSLIDNKIEAIKTQEHAVSELSSNDKEKARNWGLSEEEWIKYKSIMVNSERGVWSPNLDPITVLGIEAKTDTERYKYAELLVKKEFERAEKELAFQRAYDQAWSKVYPGILPIKTTQDDPYTLAPILFEGGRLALFVESNCLTCDNLLEMVLKTGKDVDIYLKDSRENDDFIRKWATEHKIDINRVQSRNITLNHDHGRWSELANGKIPALLQLQNNEWRHVVIK